MLRTERKLLTYYRIILAMLLVFTVFVLTSMGYFGASNSRVESFRTSLEAIEAAFSEQMRTLIGIRFALRGADEVSFIAASECPVSDYLAQAARMLSTEPEIQQQIAYISGLHVLVHDKLVVFDPNAPGAEDRYFTEILPDFLEINASLSAVSKAINQRLNSLLFISRTLMVIMTLLAVGAITVGIFMLNRYGRTLTMTLTKPITGILRLLDDLPPEMQLTKDVGDLEGLRLLITKAIKWFKYEHSGYRILRGWATQITHPEGDTAVLSQSLLNTLFTHGAIAAGAYYEFNRAEQKLVMVAEVGATKLPGELTLSDGIVGEAARTRQTRIEEGELYRLAVPIGVDQLFGVLVYDVTQLEADDPLEQQLLTEVGLQFSLVLQDQYYKNEAREKLAHLEAVVYSSLDGICTINSERIITSWNRGAEEITGYTQAEAIGRSCCDVLSHTTGEGDRICGTVDCATCRALSGQEVKLMEAHINTKNRQRVPIKLSAAPIKSNGGAINEIVLVFHDMTEYRLALARVEEANRAKSEFLATMSHELRTPLNAIIGFSDLLSQEASLTPKQQRYCQNVLRAAKHLLSLINDVLDLSKVEAGRQSWEGSTVELVPLIQNAVSLLKERAVNEGLEMIVEISPELPAIAYTDERKIKQIIYNLLSNAIKFTPPGKKIGVRAELAGASLQLTVWDQGIGIPADKIGVIFDPFIQVDSSLTRKHQGTGLGLAIVKRFVELADGEITVESEPGAGSRFIVRLPLKSTGNLAVVGEQVSPVGQVAATAQVGKCLIIEDDPDAAGIIQNYLAQLGYQSVVKSVPGEICAYLEQEQPDFITLDILLPEMSGWEILSKLRQHPKYKGIPVIIISILPEQSKGIALGADGYLVKPIDRQELYNTVTRVLAKTTVARQPDSQAKILIVDDEPMTVEVISEHLKQRGFEVASAYSAAVGLRKIEEFRPDLIILDLIMPDVNGFQFLQLKSNNPQIRDVPTVILTSKHLTQKERQHLAQFTSGIYNKADLFTQDFLSQLGELLRRRKEQ